MYALPIFSAFFSDFLFPLRIWKYAAFENDSVGLGK